MATKKQQQINGIANKQQYAVVQQTTTIDDSLLPSADELAKLREINPTIVEWTMKRAEKEQDARIEFNFKNLHLLEKEINTTARSLFYSFIIAIISLILAAVFVWADKEIAGSAFGIISITAIIQAFLRFGRNSK